MFDDQFPMVIAHASNIAVNSSRLDRRYSTLNQRRFGPTAVAIEILPVGTLRSVVGSWVRDRRFYATIAHFSQVGQIGMSSLSLD